MKKPTLILASIALALNLQSLAQQTETALAQITDINFTENSSKNEIDEEMDVAKRNRTTRAAQFRTLGHYANVGTYLNDHLQFPDEARVLGVSGMVKVEFDILPSGKISNVEVLESPLNLFSDELISVMKAMPRWSPAFRNGLPVKSRQQIHVNFRLP